MRLPTSRTRAALLAAGLIALAGASPARAQFFGRPPADVPSAAAGADVAAMGVRVERLEGQIRTMTGQIEQLQNRNRQLEDQLKRFQQDVEFRFQELSGGGRKPLPGRRSELEPAPSAAQTQEARALPRSAGHGDAFDPTRDPAAPGAPLPLGRTPASAPLSPGERAEASAAGVGAILDEPGADAPLDLANPRPRGEARAEPRVIAAPAAAQSAHAPATPQGVALDPLRSPYEQAMASYRAGQYEAADQSFRLFIDRNPADPRVPEATYYRGETLLKRGRPADAADQFLKIATNFGGSARAPDAMLKLGVSLQAMGAKEQACATFAEIARKHPRAGAAIKAADREMKRDQC